MRSFEIQAYKNGAWQTDAIYDDGDLAMLDAHRMAEGGRYLGLRLVEEVFEEGQDRSRCTIIWKSKKGTLQRNETRRKQIPPVGPGSQKEPVDVLRTREPRSARKPGRGVSLAYILWSLLLIAILGVSTLVGVDYVFRSIF